MECNGVAYTMDGEEELLFDAVKEACDDVAHSGLKAESFLVAWGGVLTLAFSAWPKPLRELKQKLNDRAKLVRSNGKVMLQPLAPENDGSKWPKSTLAALNAGRDLSPQELGRLKALCADSDKILGNCCGLELKSLSMVKYSCRSLEKRVKEVPIVLKGDNPAVCWEAAEDDRRLSNEIVAQFLQTDLESYEPKVNNGKNRLPHYREHCEEEWTLVGNMHGDVLGKVQEFTAAVENAAPSAYTFFEPSSLHVTLRTLRREGRKPEGRT